MHRFSFLSIFAVCSGVAAEPPESKPVPADIADAVRDYRKFGKMLAEPKSMGAEWTSLCRPPDGAFELEKKVGPHYGSYVQYFRNAVALVPDANAEGKLPRNPGPWPVGSILVKEKFRKEWRGKEKEEHLLLNGIAGMIKRAAGAKPESGDWEFFWKSDGKITATGLQSCAGCHSGAARDYVFTKFPAEGKETDVRR